jgi:hypothetical protein
MLLIFGGVLFDGGFIISPLISPQLQTPSAGSRDK